MARSSVGEHYVDIVGVAGSIPAAPTIPRHLEWGLIKKQKALTGFGQRLCMFGGGKCELPLDPLNALKADFAAISQRDDA